MNKKHLLYTLGFSVSLIPSIISYAQFVEIDNLPVKDITIDEPESYAEELSDLIKIQTAQQKIRVLRNVYDVLAAEEKQKELTNKKFDSMTACNIKNLSTVYQNPQEAWQKITQEYDKQETTLAFELINANRTPTNTQAEETAEQLVHWDLSANILKDVYAQPEKYGELKNGTGFSLWDDQKYMYTDQITTFISSLNSIVGRTGRIPGVSSENSYQKNAQAFKEFLNGLPKKTLSKIPSELKSFPKPPDALPPAEEILKFPEDPAQSKTVYPAWPEPWKQFIKTGFTKYNPTGEMAQLFKPKSLVFKDEIKHKDPIYNNNRLHVYQSLKKEKAAAEHAVNLSKTHLNERILHIENDLKEMGINETFDANDVLSINRVQDQLIARKKDRIQSIRSKISQNQTRFPELVIKDDDDKAKQFAILPYQEQLNRLSAMDPNSAEFAKAQNIISTSKTMSHITYINALEKDLNGNLTIFPTNAGTVDHLQAEYEAKEALREEFRKHQNHEIEKSYNKKIDDMCLNGGL